VGFLSNFKGVAIITEQAPPQLCMIRDKLLDLPVLLLGEGYRVQAFHVGNESHWEEIIKDSFRYSFDYGKQIEGDDQYRPERVLFIYHNERPVATASAWFREKYGPDMGYLHMVGVLSSYTGKGLGLKISLAALHLMRQEGRSKAVLHTDDFRLPAIKTYLKLGFSPQMDSIEVADRWRKIAILLKYRLPTIEFKTE
jgi:mycothiol synthase